MKPQFNKTWLLITLVIIVNIIIFNFMSKKLESVVINQITDTKTGEL
ncbi:MAG: hypothetical protein US04_C0001G0470 [Candidatus Nomurabacteria bacterium GW2011_GWD2_36_14]|nr:MAG: hypothetical protein UR97_C0002G0100 [Candidatus Nomurabacteria bacterium GW2011_GWE2_36_115]KKP94505.1 MAG: hypothetical protein US00_C0001G0099 [Candidatus Nomurabacteria bacterium GW2011_GWF2_36_126]KKP96967.1 MAG: hypothetical protein US04_C0001G0470 [Candidatus Nomurabacteria bacterium GW2011_GWD2_36_14]KKP99429.1 MAG: hypothetical protein US08_C0001G0111 [Candidatus Nomurabacteria bacterium GW2011_GWF2_36_19]KKQ05715.1 MAG: hypothetical protein US17_C0002G0099 [Candidatus Nomuraba